MGIAEDIAYFEQILGELIIRYEQYFLGLEKREPLQLLAEVEKASRAYLNITIVNTMLKFKYNTTVARLNSYKQYWNRINRQIEEGKYSRDCFKMELHQQQGAGKEKKSAPKVNPEIDLIYQEFLAARKACHLPTNNVTPEMIAQVIERQRPIIREKYHCDRVEFRVVIEDGMPKIKARPKLH